MAPFSFLRSRPEKYGSDHSPATSSARRVAPVIQLVFAQLPAQRVAMDPQDVRGARLVAVYTVQNALDEALLEFSYSLIK